MLLPVILLSVTVVGIIVSIVEKSKQTHCLDIQGPKICQVHQSNDLMSMLFCNFSNIFLPKWSELIQNGQFWPFCNFSNIFLMKCYELIWNGKFWLFCNFSSIFPLIDSEWPIWPFGIFSNLFQPKCSEIV